MRVLKVESGKAPYVLEIDEGLDSLQREVDGYIQSIYPWNEPCAIICDDEAKLKGKALNRALRDENNQIYDIIAGSFLIVGLGEENFISLDDTQVEVFMDRFAIPEVFIQIRDDILVIPLDSAKVECEKKYSDFKDMMK